MTNRKFSRRYHTEVRNTLIDGSDENEIGTIDDIPVSCWEK